MQCSAFYNQTKSIFVPTGFTSNADGCVSDVYFGNGFQVVFHDHWDAANISSLRLLQDINDWEDSAAYVEAHYYENASGEKCVSLSATEDPQFDKDVEGLYIHHGQIHIEGQAHESD